MRYMDAAIKLAQQALVEDEVPVGALVVKDDRIIAQAHNAMKSLQNPLYHAEILVLNAAYQKLSSLEGCALYVTLEPCAMCAGAIRLTDLSALYFGAYDTKNGGIEHGPCPLGGIGSLVIVGGIQEVACGHLLKSFFQDKRKKSG